MNAYEAKQETRRERIERAATKFEAAAAAVLNVGKDHYSRDWAFITQPGHIPARAAWNRKQDRAFECARTAKRLREKLASIGTGGISSDDPEAVIKLREELAKLEPLQARMKQANAAIRSQKKNGEAAQLSALVALGFKENCAAELLKPDFCGRIGFPNYAMTNNNANIRRIKLRIEALKGQAVNADQPDKNHDCGAYNVVECFADNRVRVMFPGRPSEAVRTTLKQHGFRWSPDAGAWQRMLNGGIVQWLTDEESHLRKALNARAAA